MKSNQIKAVRLLKAPLAPHVYWFSMIFMYLIGWVILFSEMRPVCVDPRPKLPAYFDKKQGSPAGGELLFAGALFTQV